MIHTLLIDFGLVSLGATIGLLAAGMLRMNDDRKPHRPF